MEQVKRRGVLSKVLFGTVAAAALIMAIVNPGNSASASAGTVIIAGSTTVAPRTTGTTTTVINRADADIGLNAYDITLSFNPAIASVATVTAGYGWSFNPAPRIDNNAGTVRVVARRAVTCATSCLAFDVTWNALASGTSNLALTGNPAKSLAGKSGFITTAFSSGSITVTGPAAPPTNTPIPTNTPAPSSTPPVTTASAIAAGSASLGVNGQGTSTAIVTRSAGATNFNAYDITLAFNPALVSVANVTAGSGWSLMPAPRINNAAGTVQVIAVRFDTCATTCPVFSITWSGKSAGTTSLTLTSNVSQALAGTGQYLPASFSAGSVTVTGAPQQSQPSPVTTTAVPATPSATVPAAATATPPKTAPGTIGWLTTAKAQ